MRPVQINPFLSLLAILCLISTYACYASGALPSIESVSNMPSIHKRDNLSTNNRHRLPFSLDRLNFLSYYSLPLLSEQLETPSIYVLGWPNRHKSLHTIPHLPSVDIQVGMGFLESLFSPQLLSYMLLELRNRNLYLDIRVPVRTLPPLPPLPPAPFLHRACNVGDYYFVCNNFIIESADIFESKRQAWGRKWFGRGRSGYQDSDSQNINDRSRPFVFFRENEVVVELQDVNLKISTDYFVKPIRGRAVDWHVDLFGKALVRVTSVQLQLRFETATSTSTGIPMLILKHSKVTWNKFEVKFHSNSATLDWIQSTVLNLFSRFVLPHLERTILSFVAAEISPHLKNIMLSTDEVVKMALGNCLYEKLGIPVPTVPWFGAEDIRWKVKNNLFTSSLSLRYFNDTDRDLLETIPSPATLS